jgi:superfamily I DNA/RNA helicase
MKRMDTDAWLPSDGLQLEDRALEAVKAPANVLVIAGPGAGKTELLAQKAGFLLLTGGCKLPRRILAISFKRDAARNLAERVEKRCGPLLAKRFHSVTFDAFAKGLLDKFRLGLPTPYQIGSNYEIMSNPKEAIQNAFRAADLNYYNTQLHDYVSLLTLLPLPHQTGHSDLAEIIQKAWLNLTDKKVPELNFQMIMRLASLIIETNPTLKSYLQLSYSHVFLDEFQDTTELQFQFVNTCFSSSAAVFTAVGDDKQRIMGWAGAKADIFETFVTQTSAISIALTRNFRSFPKLVHLQNYLMEHLLHKKDFATSASNRDPGDGEASLLLFDNDLAETQHLVALIDKWVNIDGVEPRKICVLVRANLGDYAGRLISLLNTRGIAARDENDLQQLLSEEIITFLIRVLSLIVGQGDYMQFQYAFNLMTRLCPEYQQDEQLTLRNKFLHFIKEKKNILRSSATTAETLKMLIVDVLKHVGIARIKALYPQFEQGNYLHKTIKDFYNYLWAYYDKSGDLLIALLNLEGDDTVPVMTIHKSKGLEFHTVVFIGLEDQTFWNYSKEREADNSVFFVALSRAKERVVFTFSEHRPGMHPKSQWRSFDAIEQMYAVLLDSELVSVEDLRKSAKAK